MTIKAADPEKVDDSATTMDVSFPLSRPLTEAEEVVLHREWGNECGNLAINTRGLRLSGLSIHEAGECAQRLDALVSKLWTITDDEDRRIAARDDAWAAAAAAVRSHHYGENIPERPPSA